MGGTAGAAGAAAGAWFDSKDTVYSEKCEIKEGSPWDPRSNFQSTLYKKYG